MNLTLHVFLTNENSLMSGNQNLEPSKQKHRNESPQIMSYDDSAMMVHYKYIQQLANDRILWPKTSPFIEINTLVY